MAISLEERIIDYVNANSAGGRLIIKREDLASQLSETVGPVSRAIKGLVDQRRLVSIPRSRMGIELQVVDEQEATEDVKEISFEQLLAQIRQLNKSQLLTVKDVVDANIMKLR
ncbi:MAG: hypothetical protein ACM3ZQ_04840 [Bacillota bacterium]